MTRSNVYVAPLTIAETAWLIAAASREQQRLVRWERPHVLADSILPKLQNALEDATESAPFPSENLVMARAEYAALSAVDRSEADLRWEATPEHVKDRIRDEAELDLL